MADYIDKKVEIIGDKKFILHKAPATVAYGVAIRYKNAQEAKNTDELQKCLYDLLKYVEIELSDGRTVPLDDPTIINQHITDVKQLIDLQAKVLTINFGFFGNAAA